jgi:hypothetical protein
MGNKTANFIAILVTPIPELTVDLEQRLKTIKKKLPNIKAKNIQEIDRLLIG